MRVRHLALHLGLAVQVLVAGCRDQSDSASSGTARGVLDVSSGPPSFPWNGHAVAFTFSSDDGDREANLAWREVFLEAEARYTLFVISGQVDAPTRLTAADINSFYADGFEIASHSVTHVRFTELSDVQLIEELVASRNALEAMIGGSYRCRTLSYPMHAHDEHVMAVTESVGYVAARNGGWNPWQGHPDFAKRAATWGQTHLFEVPLSVTASSLTDGNAFTEAETRERIQDLVAIKAVSNTWINVYAHFLTDIDADHMRWILDEMRSAGAWIGTFDEIATYYRTTPRPPGPAPAATAPRNVKPPRQDARAHEH